MMGKMNESPVHRSRTKILEELLDMILFIVLMYFVLKSELKILVLTTINQL